MNESFDEQINILKDLLDKNEFLQAQRLLLLLERDFHLEMMDNLKQQRQHLLILNSLLQEQKKLEQQRLENSIGNN